MNNPVIGYIYIRTHPTYDLENVCKLGKTSNIPDRDAQYATGEIHRGCFECVYEVPSESMTFIERWLQYEFREYNVQYDAGTEFYNRHILSLIEPRLLTLDIPFKKLSTQEIHDLVRCKRIVSNQIYTPRTYQRLIVEKAWLHFQRHDKGMLVLICGAGKTLISLWIAQELNINTLLIGVPNKLLLAQWCEMVHVLFPQVPCLVVYGGVDISQIMCFLEQNTQKCILITTYASSYKVSAAAAGWFVFGMKIFDEAHHLTTTQMQLTNTKKYIHILHIPAVKQLSLTATLKQIAPNGKDEIVSNDNIDYFGKIIDKKGLSWAIRENIICDYIIQTITTNEDKLTELNITDETEQRLFLSAFASLKSISCGYSHHLLIYNNTKENSVKVIQYVKWLLKEKYFDILNIYSTYYHSVMNSIEQKDRLRRFEKASYGIIACVYCLGEGWDFPLLDGVVFAESMTSNIRIVQSALRASRKNKDEPAKKMKIILPILNRDDWLDEKNDLKKVREVIYQMGLEDETIVQKINSFNISIQTQQNTLSKQPPAAQEFGEYDDAFTQLLLKTVHRRTFAYETARTIVATADIKTKDEYYELCKNDTRLPAEPEIVFKGYFKNWIDYLSIRRREYYDLETCKLKVSEYLAMCPDIQHMYLDLAAVCSALCKKDALFPPTGLWVEYYNVADLREVIVVTNKKKKMGVVV